MFVIVMVVLFGVIGGYGERGDMFMTDVKRLFVKCDECNRRMECDLSYLPNVYLFQCECGNSVKVQVI